MLREKEEQFVTLINQKDQEISSLKKIIEEYQQKCFFSAQDVDLAVKQAIIRREDELRVLVMKREEEVAASMNKREEEIMEAVQRRDAEICEAWVKREGEIRKEVEGNYKSLQERMDWITEKERELKDEEVRLEDMREQLEESTRKVEGNFAKGMFIRIPAITALNSFLRTQGQKSSGGSQKSASSAAASRRSDTNSTPPEIEYPTNTQTNPNTNTNCNSRNTRCSSHVYCFPPFCYERSCPYCYGRNSSYARADRINQTV